MHARIRAMRLPFLTGSMAPVLVAGAFAWVNGLFEVAPLLVAALGVACLHVASNVINDYFDAPGTDRINVRFTPFSGGSRVIQLGGLSRKAMLRMSLLFFGIAVAAGLVLGYWRTWGVVWVGLLGFLAGWLYSYQPVRLMSRGLGEATILLAFGPLISFGTYYVLACFPYGPAFWIGLPCGYLIAAVIWINEFPDLEADRDTEKRNLVVLLGLRKSRWVYAALMVLPYPTILVFAWMPSYSPWLLVTLAALPLSYKALRFAFALGEDRAGIVPLQALTIQTHLVTGLLMAAGFCGHKIFEPLIQ